MDQILMLAGALAIPLLSAPAAASSRLDTLLARGEALTARGDATCSEPLTLVAMEAERSEADYLRALGALGLCHEVAGRFGEAHRLVSRSLEGAPAETTSAGKAARWTTLRSALRRLDERVARVLVTWPEGDLYVDGKAVGGVSGRVLAVDPGRRLFEARVDGRTVAAQEVEARAGDLPAVELKAAEVKSSVFVPSSERKKSEDLRPHPLAPALSPRGVAVTMAYGATGVALVAGIVAGVLEAQRAALASGLARDACPTPDASSRCSELALAHGQSRAARDVAIVAGGVAVVAGGTAVVLWFTGERSKAVGVTWSGAW